MPRSTANLVMTIDAYARAIRRIGDYFAHDIDTLSESQLTDYFSDLIGTHSWSAVILDLYGLKFYTIHVLRKPWAMPHLIKSPKAARLPDIVTTQEAQRLFVATRTLSYRVFYFTLYSLGLRLSEGFLAAVGSSSPTVPTGRQLAEWTGRYLRGHRILGVVHWNLVY